jgi:hypothetical protein
MALPASGSVWGVAGLDMAGLAALREAEIQVPLMERGGRTSEGVAACAIRNCLKRIGIGRPDRKGSDHQKTEQHRPNSAITNPVTLIHDSPFSGYDLFPGHRLPPFFKSRFVSFPNEPFIIRSTRGRNPSVPGRRIPISQEIISIT